MTHNLNVKVVQQDNIAAGLKKKGKKMSIGIYLLIIGTIGFVGGIVGMVPKILILIGVIIMVADIIVTTTCEATMSVKIAGLEDKIKALEE